MMDIFPNFHSNDHYPPSNLDDYQQHCGAEQLHSIKALHTCLATKEAKALFNEQPEDSPEEPEVVYSFSSHRWFMNRLPLGERMMVAALHFMFAACCPYIVAIFPNVQVFALACVSFIVSVVYAFYVLTRVRRREEYRLKRSLTLAAIVTSVIIVMGTRYPLSPVTEDFYQKGKSCLQEEKLECAISNFEKAINSQPNNPDLYLDLGNAYRLSGKTDLAIADYSKALELEPGNIESLYFRSWLYNEVGEYNKAINDLDLAISFAPDQAYFYFERGFANFRVGNFDNATVDYQQTIQLTNDEELRERSESLLHEIESQQSLAPH